MVIIYGVDTEKPIKPEDVRDALVECFTQAHSQELDALMNSESDIEAGSFEEIKRANTRMMIARYFEEVVGDYDKPTLDTITKVVEKLKEYAKNFRDQTVIEKHFQEMKILLDRLPK